MFDLAIPRDSDERCRHRYDFAGRLNSPVSSEGPHVGTRVDHLQHERGAVGEDSLLCPLRIGEGREGRGRPRTRAPWPRPEGWAVGPDAYEPVRREILQAVKIVGVDEVDLSTCRSGAGIVSLTEGVFGLSRAFRVAGARRVAWANRVCRRLLPR